MANKNRSMDDFEDLFSKHVMRDDGMSIDDFGKMVSKTVNEAARNKGYDSMSEMISDEVQMGLQSRKPRKPKAAFVSADEVSNRYEYVMKAVETVHYDSRYRGNYKKGHEDAIIRYLDKIELNRNNLSIVDKILAQELKAARKQSSTSTYSRGYLDGLRFISRILQQSKTAMMKRVYEQLKSTIR